MGLNNFILTCEKDNEELRKDLEYYKNQNARLKKQNQELKSQLKGTTHCYDEEEHKKLSEQLELLISKLDEYDLIVDERNQLKKQLKNMTDNYCNASKLKHERASKIVEMNNQQKKLKEQLENSIKVNMADHKYASECEDKVVTLEAHQKEFIKYLEDEIEQNTPNARWKHYNEDGFNDYDVENPSCIEVQPTHKVLNEILQKYKEIIGVEDEKK